MCGLTRVAASSDPLSSLFWHIESSFLGKQLKQFSPHCNLDSETHKQSELKWRGKQRSLTLAVISSTDAERREVFPPL